MRMLISPHFHLHTLTYPVDVEKRRRLAFFVADASRELHFYYPFCTWTKHLDYSGGILQEKGGF